MYDVLPYLRNLKDLEEQIGEEKGGFKVIIWRWQPTKGVRVGVTSSLALLGYSVSGAGIKTFLDTVEPSEEVGKVIKFLDTLTFLFYFSKIYVMFLSKIQ